MNKKTVKRILSLVKKYPVSLIAVILFAAAEVAATLYVPLLVGDGVDLIVGAGNVDFTALSKVFLKIGAAIAAGFFKDFDDASKRFREETGKTVPQAERTAAYEKLFKKYKKISAFLTELSYEE